MSKATKRKHVTKEVLDDYVLPTEDQTIVKVLGGKGNNLHEVETDCGEKYLVSMPTKYRKNVWIKRGDFVVVQPISEGEKVKAEIINILYADQIKYIQSQEKWPKNFDSTPTVSIEHKDRDDDEERSSSSEDDSDLFVNTNRPTCEYESSDESSSDEDK